MSNPEQQAANVVAHQQPSSALVVVADAVKVLGHDLQAQQKAMADGLAGRYDPAYFQSVALSQFRKTPALWDVVKSQSGRVAFVDAVVQAAQWGLPFLAGRAYLVPFKDHGTPSVQLIVGYQGLVDLATAPGTGVTFIEAAVVYDKDAFAYQRGTDAFLHHEDYDQPGPDGVVDRGRPRLVWARVVYATGQTRFDVFDVTRIEAIRKRSRAGQSGPWVSDWDEMAKKTVLRNLCKTLRLSLAVMQAIEAEDEFEAAAPIGPAASPANTQAKLRQRVQSRLGGQDGLPAPDEAPAADNSQTSVAQGERSNDVHKSVETVDKNVAQPVRCSDSVRGPDDVDHVCGLPPRHHGRHSDGKVEW